MAKYKLVEKMKEYFENTPQEVLDKEYKEINNKYIGVGLTVDEWLEANELQKRKNKMT